MAFHQNIKRSLFKKIIYFILTAAFVLFVFEILIQASHYFIVESEYLMKKDERYSFNKFHSYLGYDGKKNISSKFYHESVSHDFLGNRITATQLDTTQENIFFVGDSQAWGYGVSNENTIPFRFSQNFTSYNTFNLGVSGFSTDQSFIKYLFYNKLYKAKFLIFIYFYNDDQGNERNNYYNVNKPQFVRNEGSYCVNNFPLKDSFSWSKESADANGLSLFVGVRRVFKLIMNNYFGFVVPNSEAWKSLSSSLACGEVNAPYRANGENISRHLMLEMNKKQEGHFLVVFIPKRMKGKGFAESIKWYQNTKKFLIKNNINYIDPIDAMLKKSDGDFARLFLWKENQHLSPLGSQIVTELIVKSLKSKGL